MLRFLLPAVAFAVVPATASAQEVFVGVMAHGVNTPLTFDTGERGTDIQVGVRGKPILNAGVASLRPYALVSKNTKGNTSFAAAGVALTLGLPGFFVRPGVGIAVHDAPSYRVGADGYRTDYGSRVLFEPELGVGFTLLPRVTAEVNWTHLSHAQIFGAQNPGLDMIGTRVTLRLP
ncbi:acyloxyacyl hydrolase [Sphingomonas adhaesiva]|uniref:acyloxyacyl hydrolase n=1 Tax=Sphingomonas adhaesiva TaxID=28212 RepID=UPI002FF65E0E